MTAASHNDLQEIQCLNAVGLFKVEQVNANGLENQQNPFSGSIAQCNLLIWGMKARECKWKLFKLNCFNYSV